MSTRAERAARRQLKLNWRRWAFTANIKECYAIAPCSFCRQDSEAWHFCRAGAVGGDDSGFCFYVCKSCMPPDVLIALTLGE